VEIEVNTEILDVIPIGFISTDFNCNILKINDKAIRFLALSSHSSTFEGQKLTDYIDDISILNQLWTFVQNGWKKMSFSNVHINNRYLNINGQVHGDRYVINITDNTTTNRALDKATQSLLIGQENEKRRISREIHDGIGQAISTVRLHLDFTMGKLQDASLIREMSRISDLISEIASDLRNLSHDLMPSSLVDFGLITAITNLTRRVNQSQSIYIHLETDLADKDLSYTYELNLYRIIQELVNNSIKHSNCKEIRIKLTLKNDVIILVVNDDGQGRQQSDEPKGIGLYNIKNRLASLNGKLNIVTSPFKGFKVLINIPFKKIHDQSSNSRRPQNV